MASCRIALLVRAVVLLGLVLTLLLPSLPAEPALAAAAPMEAADETCALELRLVNDCRLEVKGTLSVTCPADNGFCRFVSEGVAVTLDDVPMRDVSLQMRVANAVQAKVACTSVAPAESRCPFSLASEYPLDAGRCIPVTFHAGYASAPGAPTRADAFLAFEACRGSDGSVRLAAAA